MPYASVLTRYGPPEVLAWSPVAMPEPGPGQIRIRVHAAGVSPTDLKIRRGDLRQVFPLPSAVLGFEAAGTVDALGPAVTGVKTGDEVAAMLPALGGYGEYALASLILGGGGSVGLIATQLALAEGATVISATGARDEELARELGAIPVRYGPELRALVYAYAHTGKVDAVLDAAGKGGLGDAVALAGGPARVITLADEHAAD
jgi:NADPH:quinone reductase-like Zn-dependent oxidoreductase